MMKKLTTLAAILLVILMTGCGKAKAVNAPAAASDKASAALPAGFETFDETRVYGKYSAPIGGYDVKVMLLPETRPWRGSCRAILSFTNAEGTFRVVHDGWRDSLCYDEEKEALLVPPSKVLNLSYTKPKVPSGGKAFRMDVFHDVPFFFYDIDFDGKDELLINLYAQG